MTIADVVKTGSAVMQSMALMGASGAFREEWWHKWRELGQAICEENGTEFGKVEHGQIPDNTELGEKSSRLFQNLKLWLESWGLSVK